jgi:hypothetical protein
MSKATKQVLLRLTPGVKNTLVRRAKAQKLTLSDYVSILVSDMDVRMEAKAVKS